VAWDKLSGLTQTIVNTVAPGHTTTTTTSNPAELSTTATRGFVMGAGLSVKVLVIHLSPEVRFTRWGAQHFIDPNGLLHSSLNQGEFLLGSRSSEAVPQTGQQCSTRGRTEPHQIRGSTAGVEYTIWPPT